MIKRISCVLLSLLMIVSVISLTGTAAGAATSTLTTLKRLAADFPTGKYWNHVGSPENAPDSYTSLPCVHDGSCSWQPGACSCNSFGTAIQCMGYAFKICDEITGVIPKESSSDITMKYSGDFDFENDKLYVGDVVNYLYGGHYMVIVGVSGDSIAYTDCNWDHQCGIRWTSCKKSEIAKTFVNLRRVKNNKRTNTDLKFFGSVKVDDSHELITPADKTEIWKMPTGYGYTDPLNLRSGASTEADVIATIPVGAKYYTYEKKENGEYLWTRTKYGELEGWSVLDYSEYVSGQYYTMTVRHPDKVDADSAFTIGWNSIPGADKYTVTVVNKGTKKKRTFTSDTNTCIISVWDADKYAVTVKATSSHAPSWSLTSSPATISVTQAPTVAKNSITLAASNVTLDCGKSAQLYVKISPASLASGLKFTSSNKSVAFVSEDGTVKALRKGTATITVSSGSVKAKATVKAVLPAPSLTQKTAGTTVKTIQLALGKVARAEGYRIYRVNSKGEYVFVADTTATAYKVTGLSAGKTVRYAVRAYQTLSGKRVYSAASKTLTASTTPPAAAKLAQTESTETGYTLKWTRVPSATSYVLYKYNSATKKYAKFRTVTTNSASVSGKHGRTDTYKVAAVIKTGAVTLTSAMSPACLAVVAPAAPALSANRSGTSVKLSWKKATGATGYQLYVKVKDGKWTFVKTFDAKTFEYSKMKLDKAKSYWFKVRAITVNNTTKAYGAFSKPVKV